MKNTIGIYDHVTGENVVREMTTAEQTQRNAEVKAWLDAKENAKLEAEQLKQTKIAAYQKLGLNEAEIEALLPTPKPDLNPEALQADK
jgi:phosphoenolpyruvate synthase/pyruvate phosphate dikinase